MFLHLEQILLSLASYIHLALFAPVASFIEEIIPPIPSPAVMVITGSVARVQDYILPGLLVLVLLGAVGKTLGASVVYFVFDKAEDLLTRKITNFLGLTHQQIEAFGARLSKSWKDYVILTILRSLPIVPSTLLSVGGGLLKINFKMFLVSTFIGSVVRDAIYVYVGYAATTAFVQIFIDNANSIESYVQIIVVLLAVILLGFLYYRQKKSKV
jgi:membrane protein DedA with SNARE-associated domain